MSIRAFSRELVLFRTQGGQPALLDAFCPHLGANLSVGGRVVDGNIRCPFHGWQVHFLFFSSLKCSFIITVCLSSTRRASACMCRTRSSCHRTGLRFCLYSIVDAPARACSQPAAATSRAFTSMSSTDKYSRGITSGVCGGGGRGGGDSIERRWWSIDPRRRLQ
jgi:hypothetical protein